LISDLFDAIRAGAVGYLNKSLAPDALIRALCGFLRGESIPMSRANAQKILDGYRARVAQPSPEPPPPNLTSREKEVLSLIARGARDREIAERLVVTESTARAEHPAQDARAQPCRSRRSRPLGALSLRRVTARAVALRRAVLLERSLLLAVGRRPHPY